MLADKCLNVPFFIEPGFLRNSVLKWLFTSFLYENDIFYDEKKIFSTSRALMSKEGKGDHSKGQVPSPPMSPVPIMTRKFRRPFSNMQSSRFGTITHTDAPGPVLCCLLYSFCFFLSFSGAFVFTFNLKLSELELSTFLLGCQFHYRGPALNRPR